MQSFQKKDAVFSQGDATDGLFFIQTGKIRLSVVSDAGKEATLGILSKGDFFGEGGLAGQPLRMSSAIAVTDCTLLHVEKRSLLEAMSLETTLSTLFINLLLQRNLRYQDDLVDQLFNSSERRLARVLLLMSNFGEQGISEMTILKLRQETLAEMVGTTRSRVSFFMNRFRKLGFIDYGVGDSVHVKSSLLNVLLHDDDVERGQLSEVVADSGVVDDGSEPPATPGRPPDNEQAKSPSLPDPERPKK